MCEHTCHTVPLPRALRSPLTLVVVRERLPSAVCARSASHTLLFACTPLSAKNAFTMIFTSSADLSKTLAALVPWPWAVLVRPCALSFLWRHDVQCDFLDVRFVHFDQPAKSNLVADLVRQKGFQSGPVRR